MLIQFSIHCEVNKCSQSEISIDLFVMTFKIKTLCVCGSTEHIYLAHTDTFLESQREAGNGYRGHRN